MKRTLTALTYCLMMYAHHHHHVWIEREDEAVPVVAVIAHVAR